MCRKQFFSQVFVVTEKKRYFLSERAEYDYNEDSVDNFSGEFNHQHVIVILIVLRFQNCVLQLQKPTLTSKCFACTFFLSF